MSVKAYFETAEGIGILSTADGAGNVDAAIYAKPHVVDSETVTFVMRQRRTFDNLRDNPKAVYLFIEKAPGYRGKRLYLEKIGEESDPQVVGPARHRARGHGVDADEAQLVTFRITRIRPLVGDTETE
jgi:hypothetical protein